MKKVMLGLLFLVLSSFVIAQGSEITTEFNIGKPEVGKDYVSTTTFWDTYGAYVIGLVVVFIAIAIVSLSKKKKAKHKKVSHKKVSHKKVKGKRK